MEYGTLNIHSVLVLVGGRLLFYYDQVVAHDVVNNFCLEPYYKNGKRRSAVSVPSPI